VFPKHFLVNSHPFEMCISREGHAACDPCITSSSVCQFCQDCHHFAIRKLLFFSAHISVNVARRGTYFSQHRAVSPCPRPSRSSGWPSYDGCHYFLLSLKGPLFFSPVPMDIRLFVFFWQSSSSLVRIAIPFFECRPEPEEVSKARASRRL